MEIKAGQKVFVLNRGVYDPNDKSQLVAEYKATMDGDNILLTSVKNCQFGSKNSFHYVEKENKRHLYVFSTFEEGLVQYNLEREEWKNNIMSKSKLDFAKDLLRNWGGESIRDDKDIEVMKAKFKLEFGVNL